MLLSVAATASMSGMWPAYGQRARCRGGRRRRSLHSRAVALAADGVQLMGASKSKLVPQLDGVAPIVAADALTIEQSAKESLVAVYKDAAGAAVLTHARDSWPIVHPGSSDVAINAATHGFWGVNKIRRGLKIRKTQCAVETVSDRSVELLSMGARAGHQCATVGVMREAVLSMV